MEQYLAGKMSPVKTRIKSAVVLIVIFSKSCIDVKESLITTKNHVIILT